MYLRDARRAFVRSSVRSFVGSPPPTDASLARARVMAPNPPPDPFVLRGHATDVQCVSFDARFGARALETGDADGVVITWDTRTTMSRIAIAPAVGACARARAISRRVRVSQVMTTPSASPVSSARGAGDAREGWVVEVLASRRRRRRDARGGVDERDTDAGDAHGRQWILSRRERRR